MGAPKQKWTQEEEAALRAGVDKYGPGKWRAILKDPTLSLSLALRSNVDLKDKWRNMSVTANGWGSREKARLALKRSSHMAKHTGRHLALSAITNGNTDAVVDVKPLASVNPYLHSSSMKRSTSRLDNLILDAVSSLREPNGSNKSAIAMHIEDNHPTPPNFRRLLSPKLKSLVAGGKLVKMRQNYMISGNFPTVDERTPRSAHSGPPNKEAKHTPILLKDSSKKVIEEIRLKTKSEIDAELAKMRTMNAEEAAKAAAAAVAEAESAIAEAEQAAREAEAAEADAEAAQAFAEAAMMTLRNSKNSVSSLR